ncbi:hypothetical protein LCGC14_0825580 [marine sediment metagenome]|uniref:Uncharacterized protein n=1 Tax=marine sediment metagenome TaxID=412755 RepID=A0A0F9PM97_9ZZZZ
MKLRNYINTSLIGLIGSILLIVSEFFSWFSGYNLIEIYLITTSVAIEDSFLFLFPLISGIICLIGSILVIYKYELRIKSVIISFVGLGFLLIFFFDYISQEIEYFSNAGPGLYLGVAGFLLIVFNIIIALITKENNKDGN